MKSYVYLLCSIVLTVGCLYYSYYKNPSVFGIDFSFSTSKMFVPVGVDCAIVMLQVIGNLYISLFINILTIFKSIFIGNINDQEKEHITRNVSYGFFVLAIICRIDFISFFFSIIYLKDSFSVSDVLPISLWIYLSYSAYLLDARMKTVLIFLFYQYTYLLVHNDSTIILYNNSFSLWLSLPHNIMFRVIGY